ncbi:DNA mismatch repair endonuclease MutL [Haloparvum alkalitolerans]|uniref:DNA mismatch repair endonuclease MutL n=1 Tax=Haloparvum alkalitolerans TaxID=1042953 RepID=UPI003CE8D493
MTGRSGGGPADPSEEPGDARVRRLGDATVDRIAAGEVVTRPARVVGELLDNALDAGAGRVEVAVRGDGTERVRVRDDGRGMSRADAELAVERHATSKLRDGEDPVGVTSLGFRGEALPAIAKAARLELVTGDGGAQGTRVVVDGGEVAVSDAGRARGTTVTVEDLFRDRPARREALAGPETEFARISDLVADYALARPDVAFTLVHDGRETLSTPGTGASDALLGVYDRDVASRSTALDASVAVADLDGKVGVSGALAYPSVTRASRDHVRVAVNGRPVENARLARAVRAGYGRLLPDGREPVAAVSVSLPPEAVDPNVHPAKREVGLRAGDAVADAVETAVGDALTGADLRRKAEVATGLDAALSPMDGADPFAAFEPIGQYADLYLLCDAGEELVVIDVHAAHERVNYERLRRAFDGEAVPTAALDPPVTVSLSAPAVAAVEAHGDALARLGFDAEAFGGGTVRLRSVPAPFGRAADADAFRDALDALADGESPADARDALLADLACHPSLKRGDALDGGDARALLDRLGECERPFACPHGRPTTLSVEEATLAEGFERRPRR